METITIYKIRKNASNDTMFSCNPETAQDYSDKGYIVNANMRKFKAGGFP